MGIEDPEEKRIYAQDYYASPKNKTPRYYQLTAINRTIGAIAKGSETCVARDGNRHRKDVVPNHLAPLEIRN
jgi:alcohol dehydrogenase class IV